MTDIGSGTFDGGGGGGGGGGAEAGAATVKLAPIEPREVCVMPVSFNVNEMLMLSGSVPGRAPLGVNWPTRYRLIVSAPLPAEPVVPRTCEVKVFVPTVIDELPAKLPRADVNENAPSPPGPKLRLVSAIELANGARPEKLPVPPLPQKFVLSVTIPPLLRVVSRSAAGLVVTAPTTTLSDPVIGAASATPLSAAATTRPVVASQKLFITCSPLVRVRRGGNRGYLAQNFRTSRLRDHEAHSVPRLLFLVFQYVAAHSTRQAGGAVKSPDANARITKEIPTEPTAGRTSLPGPSLRFCIVCATRPRL